MGTNLNFDKKDDLFSKNDDLFSKTVVTIKDQKRNGKNVFHL
jgi:hypothetical protein